MVAESATTSGKIILNSIQLNCDYIIYFDPVSYNSSLGARHVTLNLSSHGNRSQIQLFIRQSIHTRIKIHTIAVLENRTNKAMGSIWILLAHFTTQKINRLSIWTINEPIKNTSLCLYIDYFL